MKIPKEFKCAGNVITVNMVDKLKDHEYGNWCDATNTIELARSIYIDEDNTVELTEEQITNSFYHELGHCFQFYFDNSCDEAQAQTFANFMCEFMRTANTVENEFS
jgi:hypothetical protein